MIGIVGRSGCAPACEGSCSECCSPDRCEECHAPLEAGPVDENGLRFCEDCTVDMKEAEARERRINAARDRGDWIRDQQKDERVQRDHGPVRP